LKNSRQTDSLLREQLDLCRPARRYRRVLQEDVAGVDPQARQELEDGLREAVGVKLQLTGFEQSESGITANGILQLTAPVRFSLSNTQPDRLLLTTDSLQLTATAAQAIGKLQAYYQTWYEQSSQPETTEDPTDALPDETTLPAPATV
jgi:hypothetical protein